MSLTPAHIEILSAVAAEADAAGHGGKGAVYAAATQRLGISLPTLMRHLGKVRRAAPRKRRSDAGAHSIDRDAALRIATVMTETRRLTDTGTLALERALDILQTHDPGFACRLDASTGELIPLSLSAIRRALAHHHCHPEQLIQPTAAVSIASDHPNHLWQVDASVSRQFYLADGGTQVMDASVYYRGKPQNFIKINEKRLIRYCVTDHCSGYIRVFYVRGSESALGVISALIHAMTPMDGIAMHGVPRLLWMDKGSLSQLVEAFCEALDVECWAHAAGNPRALGAAEQAHNLIEQNFEAPLKLREPVRTLEEMNTLATLWCRWYNSTREHSRHGLTREACWLRITPQQLRLAPAPEVLKALATSAPVECTVRNLEIRYKRARWDVRELPGVINGGKVQVSANAYDPETVRIQMVGADGKPGWFLAPRIQRDEWGFAATAARAGEEFAAMPETPADATRREIERLAMQAATDEEAKANRKAKRVAFGGEIDPTRPWREADIVPHLPRAGTASAVEAPAIVAPAPLLPEARPQYVPVPLSHVEMARGLKRRVEAHGGSWSAELYARMAEQWPQGVPEEQLDACAVALLRSGLRAVQGGVV